MLMCVPRLQARELKLSPYLRSGCENPMHAKSIAYLLIMLLCRRISRWRGSSRRSAPTATPTLQPQTPSRYVKSRCAAGPFLNNNFTHECSGPSSAGFCRVVGEQQHPGAPTGCAKPQLVPCLEACKPFASSAQNGRSAVRTGSRRSGGGGGGGSRQPHPHQPLHANQPPHRAGLQIHDLQVLYCHPGTISSTISMAAAQGQLTLIAAHGVHAVPLVDDRLPIGQFDACCEPLGLHAKCTALH
jgi:hypothetical protein